MTDIRKPVALLIALLVASAILFIVAATFGVGTESITLTPPASSRAIIPPLTSQVAAYLAASHGFQYLVSYTGRGFEPATLTIKKGETVRFTNNSTEGLWVAATGSSGRIYPAGGSTECGQSAFDSCRVIGSGEFWEFTFIQSGTWSYRNNNDTNMTGTIVVK